MIRHMAALLLVAVLVSGCSPSIATSPDTVASDQIIGRAFEQQQSGLQVTGVGQVIRILSDDTNGDRHQRFIIELSSGQTLLVAHNIDVAPRIPSLRDGDEVEFHGVYEWNDEGGVIHWTHHDPDGSHEAGWLKHSGGVYQ